MGEMTDKIKGHTNEAIGKAKRAAGEALDRPDIKACLLYTSDAADE